MRIIRLRATHFFQGSSSFMAGKKWWFSDLSWAWKTDSCSAPSLLSDTRTFTFPMFFIYMIFEYISVKKTHKSSWKAHEDLKDLNNWEQCTEHMRPLSWKKDVKSKENQNLSGNAECRFRFAAGDKSEHTGICSPLSHLHFSEEKRMDLRFLCSKYGI